jgi:hypothetical protein
MRALPTAFSILCGSLPRTRLAFNLRPFEDVSFVKGSVNGMPLSVPIPVPKSESIHFIVREKV